MSDLILRGGRVIGPASGRDETADVGFADGRVKAIGSDLPGGGAEIVDARGLLVAPGLIDLRRRSAGKISEAWRAGRSATQPCSHSSRASSIIATF